MSLRYDKVRIALVDAMQLHDERLESANVQVRRLRAELEKAEQRQVQVREARLRFIRYIESTEPTNDR